MSRRVSQAGAVRQPFWPWVLVGALVIIAGALWVWNSGGRIAPPVIAAVPSFHLVDQTGNAYGSDDLRGKVWIASFIYSTCPGPCPRVVERMGHVRDQIGDEIDLRLVSFSVDPQTDTPEVLAEYGKQHDIDPQRWHLLTGPVDDVVTLIRKGFMLALQRSDAPEAAKLATDGPVIHSTRLVLVDRSGRIRGYYETNDPDDMTRLVADARTLLRNKAA